MSRTKPAAATFGAARRGGGLAALSVCVLLGACAQASKPTLPAMLAQDEAPAPEAQAARSELAKATEYWGKEYAKEPRNLEAALSYAKNLKAMGEKKRALGVLQQASVFHGANRELASEYGRLALEFDQVGVAGKLLAAADDPANPDWRIISARGTVLAKQGKYKDAIPFYETALSLAPDHPSILSNLALAHAMNGEPKRAEAMLRQAATTDRNSLKIRQNLALVLGLQGKYDEAKLLASNDLSAENASENAEYLRRVVKLEQERPAQEAKEAPFETEIESEPRLDRAPERQPVATSKKTTKPKDAKTAAQAGGILRGTMMPTVDAANRKPAVKPEQTPSFDTTFSVAQWSPQTEPTALEFANDEPPASAAPPVRDR